MGLSTLQLEKCFFTNPTVTAILGSISIYFVAYWITNVPKITEMRVYKCLLKNSMYIYLFHEPVNFIMLRWAINNNVVSNGKLSVIFFLGRMIGSIVLSIVLGEIIDNIKKQHICSLLIKENE